MLETINDHQQTRQENTLTATTVASAQAAVTAPVLIA
jgi:hypothetical protein